MLREKNTETNKSSIKIAINLLSIGLSDEDIIKATGLSKEEIDKLKEESR